MADRAAKSEIDSKKGQAWTAASRDLREAEPAKWLEFLRKRYEELGLTWNPRPSAEEKARAQLDQILAEHPELAEELAERVVSSKIGGDLG